MQYLTTGQNQLTQKPTSMVRLCLPQTVRELSALKINPQAVHRFSKSCFSMNGDVYSIADATPVQAAEVSVCMEAPTSSSLDVPPFARAVQQLQEFIGNQGVVHPPIWVFRNDLVSVKWRIWVRKPLPKQNYALAEAFYEKARARGLGVALEVICLLEFEPFRARWYRCTSRWQQ